MFRTEQDCIDYLVSLKWPNGFQCPQCGSIRFWKKNKGRYECSDCHKETTVTNNTMFHKTTKPLLIWFRAIWWMVAQKNGVSAKGLQKVHGLGSYQTAWTWLHKFRRLMILSGRAKLHGTVEVDEVLVGGKTPGKRGRGAEGKSLVAVAVEIKGRKTGRVRLEKIPDASGKSLKSFVERNIEPSSIIITDGWSGYSELGKMSYIHKVSRSVV